MQLEDLPTTEREAAGSGRAHYKHDASKAVRSFLAYVRPLEGCCMCGDEAYHGGRAAVELIALALTYEEAPMPTAEQCVDVLYYLTCIQPLDSCYGCAGSETQCGLNYVLECVRDRLAEVIEKGERLEREARQSPELID